MSIDFTPLRGSRCREGNVYTCIPDRHPEIYIYELSIELHPPDVLSEERCNAREHVTAACALRAFAADLAVSNKHDWTHQISYLIRSLVARAVQRDLALVSIASLSCLKLHAASLHSCRCNASKSSSAFGSVVVIGTILKHALHPSCCLWTPCSSNIKHLGSGRSGSVVRCGTRTRMRMRQVNTRAGVREGNWPNAADVAVILGIR